MKVRALIVEDEPLPRRALRDLVDEVDWLELVGEAANGREALERIDALHPDLVFLDVQMPEMSGIEVANRAHHRPAIVFTTAFDRYAVAAFELEAIDYLIKPFGRKRFLATLERVRRRLADPDREPHREAHGGAGPTDGFVERLYAHKGQRIVPLRVAEVVRITAADDYTEVHGRGETFLLPLRLQDLERRLDPARFVRVHRSHVVNLDHVRQMLPRGDRQIEIHMTDGATLLASRAGSRKLKDLIR